MLERNYCHKITHWSSTPADFGSFTFGTPQTVLGRWVEKAELFRDAKGEEVVSQAVAHLSIDVSVDDYLLLGESEAADPTLVADTAQVKQFAKRADLRTVDYQRKAFM